MNTLKAIEKAYGNDAYFAVFLDRVGAAIKTGVTPLGAVDSEIGSFKAAFRMITPNQSMTTAASTEATADAPAPKVRKKRGPNKKTLARLAAEAAAGGAAVDADAGAAEVTTVSGEGGEVITKTASGRGRGRRKRTGLPLVPPVEESAVTPLAADVAAEVSEVSAVSAVA